MEIDTYAEIMNEHFIHGRIMINSYFIDIELRFSCFCFQKSLLRFLLLSRRKANLN